MPTIGWAPCGARAIIDGVEATSSRQDAYRRARARGVAVRETRCTSILNKTAISDYSLNCYTGCEHGCAYCYARFMQRFHPHPEPWGEFVDVKANAVEVLERQLRRARPGNVFMSSACDGWQPLEADLELTRRCCDLLLAHGFQVNVLTKSGLALRDLDIFEGRTARVGVTITTVDERLRRLWEGRSSPVEERVRLLAEAKRLGLETSVMFGPLLPFLSDDEKSLEALFERAADLDIDVIWVDAMNPKPRVWPSVESLLVREFPDLVAAYRRVLFDGRSRSSYLAGLHRRIERAAAKYRLGDRLAGCP